MDPLRWQEIKSTFDTIVEMDDVERGTRLTALSTSDPELRDAVELLLAADSHADRRLASLDAAFFPESTPDSDPLGLAGQTVSHFEIQEAIGAGGMGVVYRAQDTRLGRAVALKFLLPSHSLEANAKARLLREAHLVATLDHPNICSIHEVGTTDDGRFFLAMALYQGETLKARLIRVGAMSVPEALEITKQFTEGLRCAHDAGIVHRDLKPGNIVLLPDGTVKILDFGLAKARDQSLSEPGARFGTVSYMSPEQIRGVGVNTRADLWAVGAVLYEMLTGRKPFEGDHDIAIAHAILHNQPVPISTLRNNLSAPLEDLVERLLQKDPSRRYATAQELTAALTLINTGAQGTVGSVRMRLRRAWNKSYRYARSEHRGRLTVGGGVAAVAIGAALIPARPPVREPPDRVQLTFTGNAVAPSMSPDGRRLAFGEKQCDQAGYCTFQLVVQDIDGTGRAVLVRNIGYIYKTQWSSDGGLVEFSGSHPPLRHGAFVVPTLGGEPKYLGCCAFELQSGDTALLVGRDVPGVNRAWVRRLTVHDGRTLDSIPVYDQGVGYHLNALTIPDRLMLAVWETSGSAPELRLTNFRGQVINRFLASSWSPDVTHGSRWVPRTQKLVLASKREFAATSFDILSVSVKASRIEPGIDTVFSGLPLHNGLFDVSPDGERLIYSAGPVETSLSSIELDRRRPTRLAATQVLSSTTMLRGRISPDGDRIFLARDALRAGANASQFFFIRRTGGAEWQMPGAIENLLDFQWSPDGVRVMYLQGIGSNEIRLMEMDTTGDAAREIARMQQAPGMLSWNRGSAAVRFHPLPNGAVGIISADRHSISIIRRPGKRDVTWHVPEWISEVGRISHSPDAKSLAVEAQNRSGDSVVVATVDIESGHLNKVGVFGGSDPQYITWLDDGSIMFAFREKQGAFALYRVVRGRQAERLGALPNTQAEFSVSNDGRYVAAFGYSDRNDVYMIRNFGKMLRR